MTRLASLARRWRRRGSCLARSEEGASTVEFALAFPVVMIFFLGAFELGMMLTRQVMLDRGLDMTVRDVRLGRIDPVTHDDLKAMICNRGMIIPDCLNQLRLEMRRVDPRDWSFLDPRADCVDRADPARPVRSFVPGSQNDLMVLRACALFDPFFPTTGLGFAIPKESQGAYALLSTTSFVIEPN